MTTNPNKYYYRDKDGNYVTKKGDYTSDGMHKRKKGKFGCKRYGIQFYCFEECPFSECLEFFDGMHIKKLIIEYAAGL